MKTLAIVSQKGGVGKTTLAFNLAVCAQRSNRRVVLFDIDPQASASAWNNARENAGGARIEVIKTNLRQLGDGLDAARRRNADLAIIDTAPCNETIAAAASRLADFVLIPTPPAFLDLESSADTIGIAANSGTPFSVLFSRAPPNGINAVTQARELLESIDCPVLPHVVHQYAAFCHSSDGSSIFEHEPDSIAAEEIKTLFHALKKVMAA